MTTAAFAQKSADARHQLVQHLQATGVAHSRAILDAFAAIPREAFVSAFYQEQNQGRSWMLCQREDMPEDQWLASIYTDEALITQMSERNRPISSSSMPTVMARMLEALAVLPGQRVLEIGTGTGYNAALLSLLTGNPACVATVEIDPQMAERAKEALVQTVGAVNVQVGDGYRGTTGQAQFDRVIATAGCAAFPWTWYRQLAPGGRLVVDLQGTLGISSFFVLDKALDGKSARGHFRLPRLHFMPMRNAVPPAPSSSLQPTTWSLPAEHPLGVHLQHTPCRWFAQWRILGLTGSHVTLTNPQTRERVVHLHFSDATGQTRLDLKQPQGREWNVQCIGSRTLWDELQQTVQEWETLGQPEQKAYHVEIWDEEGAMVINKRRLPLPNASPTPGNMA